MKFLGLFVPVFIIAVLFGCPDGAGAGALYDRLWGGFSTPVAGRSVEQLHNAGRAANDLNGTIIAPGGIFSFNELVGGRESGKGYTRAPVITDRGDLQDAPGGGICQLATTIYNAALYSGLDVVERHPHSRLVTYVPAGRDATIATWRKDLKLRNPHQVPLMLRIVFVGGRLTASFWSVEDKNFQVQLHTDSIPLDPETAVIKSAGRDGLRLQRGGKGVSVITRRSFRKGDVVTEKIISEDIYPPPSRILAGDAL
jgi:vancomycin resistance protein VanW